MLPHILPGVKVADVVAIMGVHSGMNKIVARPEIKDLKDIKGKAVAVDPGLSLMRQSACFNCHKPLDKQDYVYLYDKMKTPAK